jgi:putative ABC transport system permease protein
MVLWKFTLRELKNRPGRATLTLLSIVIAVSAIVAVNVSSSTTRRAYEEMYSKLAGRAALEVIAEGGGAYDEGIVAKLEEVAGVKTAVPIFRGHAKLFRKTGRLLFFVMGIDPLRDEAVRDYRLVDGESFRDDEGALMEAGFARGLEISVGDEIGLLTTKGYSKIPVIGFLAPEGAAQFNQGGTAFVTLRAAQRMFGKPRSINATSLVLDDSADPAAVQAQITRILPTGLTVRPPLARAQLGKETLQSLDQGLSFAYTLTLVLATIVILNTFLMNIGERRRQLAILRALGTTRGQIMRMLLREGLVLGLVGTAAGILLGLGGAYGLSIAMARAYSASVNALEITWQPFVLAGLLGPGMAMVAMFVPAYLAGKVTPLEGMRPLVTETTRPASAKITLLGIALVVLTGLSLVACIFGYLPIQMATPCGVAYTAALVLLIPAVLAPVTRLIAWVFRPMLGTAGQLAQRQIARRRTRSTLTVGVLYVGLSAGLGLGTAILNNVQDVRKWQEKTFVGDFFVRAIQQNLATNDSAPMPESLKADLAGIDGVTSVEAIRFLQDVTAADTQVNAVLRDYESQGENNLLLDLKAGDAKQVRQRLLEGEVVVGTVLAHRAGIKYGGEVTLQTRQGPKSLRVAGITNDYVSGGLVVHLERAFGKKLLAAEGADIFIVRAQPSALGEVESRIKSLCGQNNLLLLSFADLRRRLDNLMNGVVAGLWGIMTLGLVVAGFAVANTLTMNVLEQTREIAMLRVVAMTRRQVRKTILSQAVILGVFGVTFGVIAGMVAAYTTNLCTPAVTGRPIEFVLSPALLIGTYAVALAIILLAAWLPARRAMRLNLLIALQYE